MKLEVKLKKIGLKLKELYFKYNNIIIMSLPFIILDLATRILGKKIGIINVFKLVPNLFTVSFIILIIGLAISFKKVGNRIFYTLFFIISLVLFLTHNIYYSMTGAFFDFNLVEMASEGSYYIVDAIKNANLFIYVIAIIDIILFIFGYHVIPKNDKANLKRAIIVVVIFILGQITIPTFLGKPNTELSWNTWRNPRNIYINFNDSVKSMSLTGLYQYSFRNFYLTYLKEKKTNDEDEIAFLEEVFSYNDTNYKNEYTGLFKNKNIIFLQLEGIDNWILNETNTPTLYNLMNNGINFTNHFSYYNGGGSTFNSEFAVNTGYLTPISYTRNAYTFNKNTFTYSMANLFKNEGYTVNAFHMNSYDYYSRGINYENFGFDNYYGLKDLGYSDKSYTLDRELILNETFYEKMFLENDKFVNYIITYSNHLPFSSSSGVCKMLLEEDMQKELENNIEEDNTDTTMEIPVLSEEECVKRQARETDDMVKLLIQALEDNNLIDNTVLVVFTDHYLYTLSDQSIIARYKPIDNNLVNKTPFFIYSKDIKAKTINEVTSQLNILPTILNLVGLEYHPNYYIGEDSLSDSYRGYVFFNDYSWYDGNVYVDGGVITNGKYLDPVLLEEKNNFINYLIRKNDLTLKYDYFKIKTKHNDI